MGKKLIWSLFPISIASTLRKNPQKFLNHSAFSDTTLAKGGKAMNKYERIIDEYMQQIFYFSLKKTSDQYEAEELTQTIMMEILISLKNGVIPDDERAWIWKIARNHYAKWAALRSKNRHTFGIDDICDSISDNFAIDDSLIKNEEITLLYRELALLTHDHRHIVCEYYFENHTLADIAKSLGLPIGTVKRKIYECRKNLKEGMKMARTYGKRSFAPENMNFTQNWNPQSGRDGNKYIEHLSAQNILLEAYDNPCTAEDLSLSLGIAMPYMEDEIRILLDGELLTEEHGKYRTNIVILSKKAQDAIYELAYEYADKMTELMMKTIDEIADKPERPQNQSFEDMKPALVELVMTYGGIKINSDTEENRNLFNIFTIKHLDGSEWAIAGFEKTDKQTPFLEVCGHDKFEIIMLGNRTEDALDIDKSQVPTFSCNSLDTLLHTSQQDALSELWNSYRERRNQILKNDIPSYLYGKAMVSTHVDFRKIVIDRMIASGYIKLPADMNKSAVGIWMFE